MDVLKYVVALAAVMTVVYARRSRIIDLPHQLKSNITVHPLFPGYDFRVMRAGPWGRVKWIAYNWFGTVEHTGTHMDAPYRFVQDGMRVHEIPLERFIGPGVIIRVSEKARLNPDYQLTVDDILEWEAKHGLMPDNAIVLMDSGWTHKFADPVAFFGSQDISNRSTFHFPSNSSDVAEFIAKYRQHVSILGAGVISLDPGDSATFPVHTILQPLGFALLENIAHLDKLPEAGSIIYCMPLNIYGGTGSPIRAFAVLGDDVMGPEFLHPYGVVD